MKTLCKLIAALLNARENDTGYIKLYDTDAG